MHVERVPVDVPTRAPTGRTACYVVGDNAALLVDPPVLDERIERHLADVEHVAVTHHHPDHVGAVADYAEAADAAVWCRYGRESQFQDATGAIPDHTFREGTTIPTDDGDVTVRETPGHAPEHVAFGAGDDLLSGDLAVAAGSVVVGDPEGDVRAYLTSLRRVWAMDPARLYPSHGPVIEDVRGTCERLITHRLDRERRVLDAVEADNRTVADILDFAYEKDLTGVEDLAGATVRAHLWKLHHEGRVEWDGARAVPA
ncbi:MBL fold metallo-hydrolase [Natronomonas gomsonensis]|jgi:ribonuclease/clavin/mitogillin|uniref:MBL fold metallo-hydrolase n=1 Tax=Natronomonas gomsonensis TaxID=1046043 RepID=UPI0020CA95DD|nr:MBL fold metallo-hydrolase [Natronomonas gomsonensis]MCY4731701.1 MBL fold metallo-hydrolase [Natronomonas gomsonensis]